MKPSRTNGPCAVYSSFDVREQYHRYAANPESMADAKPILQTSYPLSPGPLSAIEELVQRMELPVAIGPAPTGVDGTSYLFEVRARSAQLTVEWWEKGPANWAELAQCFRKLWTVLEKLRH